MEYLVEMFNDRTKGKKYENYVVNAIYNRVGNKNLVPVTQQFVRSKKDSRKYYLLDLYFPQLNYGIEVDERHHWRPQNKISDSIREQDIRQAISCEERSIKIYKKNDSEESLINCSFEEIENQINKIVEEIKQLIEDKKANGNCLQWQTNEDYKKDVISKGFFSIEDNVDYKGITEIYNIVGHNVKSLGGCFYSLNNSYYLWVPTLAITLDDGTIKSSNQYENYLNEDHTEIIEYDKTNKLFNLTDGKWDGNKRRVVFMKMRDRFGKKCVKFIGVFKAYEIGSDGGRHYKLDSNQIKIKELKPEC